jgi:alpha-beta hydrolase superfamily lysophospholipase
MSSPTETFAVGDNITTYRWEPTGPARGIVQISHGMGEHALRYGPLAADLTGAGYAVYAQDHRGHGASATAETYGQLGPGGWEGLVADIDVVRQRALADHPGAPWVLLGHSMGSFAVQQTSSTTVGTPSRRF